MFTIIHAGNEQLPYKFQGYGCKVEKGQLYSGDYSLKGLETLISIERKSLNDFIGCCTQSGRERFKNELHRLRGFQAKAVVIEATLQEILGGRYRSNIKPQCVVGSIASWTCRYNIPFLLAGNRMQGELMTYSLLKNFYQNQMQILKMLTKEVSK